MGEKIWIRISQIQDGGGGGAPFLKKFFSKNYIFLNDGFPKLFVMQQLLFKMFQQMEPRRNRYVPPMKVTPIIYGPMFLMSMYGQLSEIQYFIVIKFQRIKDWQYVGLFHESHRSHDHFFVEKADAV